MTVESARYELLLWSHWIGRENRYHGTSNRRYGHNFEWLVSFLKVVKSPTLLYAPSTHKYLNGFTWALREHSLQFTYVSSVLEVGI